MHIAYVPTLEVQRALYRLPRDEARFKAYLWELTGGGDDLRLPLSGFNPMGREHVAEALDRLLAIDTDGVAGRAVQAAATELEASEGAVPLRATLVLSDNVGGMWTHRGTTEFQRVWAEDANLARGWVVGVAWTSDTPTPASVTRELRLACARAAYRLRHGAPRSLTAVLAQEGEARRFAGDTVALALDVLEPVRAVLHPLANASDDATVFAALYGDAAAIELGYRPLGVPANGGPELALADARARVAQQPPGTIDIDRGRS